MTLPHSLAFLAFYILSFILSPVSAAQISLDATCGGKKAWTCKGSDFGDCCSSYGWCGSGSKYCDSGCRPQYGDCSSVTQITRQKVSYSKCGPSYGGLICAPGLCCSKYGWCGSTNDHCGVECLVGFGDCKGVASSSSMKTLPRTSSSSKAPSSRYLTRSTQTMSSRSNTKSLSAPVPSAVSLLKRSSSSAGSSLSTRLSFTASSSSTKPSSTRSLPTRSSSSSFSSRSSPTKSSSASLSTESSSLSLSTKSAYTSSSTRSSSASSSIQSSSSSSSGRSSSVNSSTRSTSGSSSYTGAATSSQTSSASQSASTSTGKSSSLSNEASSTASSSSSSSISKVVSSSSSGSSTSSSTVQSSSLSVSHISSSTIQLATASSPPFLPFIPNNYDDCQVNPYDGTPFLLLDANSGLPLINHGGIAELPTDVIEDANLEYFIFSSPPDARQGLFDMVLGSAYLALYESGKVGFVSESSNGQDYQGTGDRYITTAFSVGCDNRITPGIIGGPTFELVVVDNQWRVKVLTSAPQKQKRGFYTPPGIFVSLKAPPVPPNQWRCPNNRKAKTKSPPIPPTTNGCGTSTGIGSFVPELDFTQCCNGHDTCFGLCDETFISCNERFLSCNIDRCKELFPSTGLGINTLRRWACTNMAKFYGYAVTSRIGSKALREATQESCDCPQCDDGLTFCPTHGPGYECVDIMTDRHNCGACDAFCPSGVCTGGWCDPRYCIFIPGTLGGVEFQPCSCGNPDPNANSC